MFNPRFIDWTDRSKTIDLFRLVSILCVVLTHIPYQNGIVIENLSQVLSSNYTLSLWDNFILFLKYGLGRVASPALSLVSAWFLLRSLEQKTFLNILKSKSENLLIPYVFWNFAHVAFFILIWLSIGRDPYGFADHPAKSFWDSTFNLYKWPNNGPLHYLLDLFEIIIFYTIFHKFFQAHRWVLVLLTALSPALLLYFGKSDSWLGDNSKSLLPRADLVFFFFIGVLTFSRYQSLFADKVVKVLTDKIVIILLVLSAFAASKFMFFYIESIPAVANPENIIFFYITLALRAICSLLIFSISLIVYTRWQFSTSRKAVFRIFCSHAIVIWIANGMMNDIFSDEHLGLRYLSVFISSIIGGAMINYALKYLAKKWPLKFWKYV